MRALARSAVLFAAGMTAVAVFGVPMAASATPSSSIGCSSARGSLLSEESSALNDLASINDVLAPDKRELKVAQQFGDFDRAKELNAEIAGLQPRFDLLTAQEKAIKKDRKLLASCSAKTAALVSKHVRVRNLVQLRLDYSEDLRNKRAESTSAEYEIGVAQQSHDKESVALYRTRLKAIKASIAEDKRDIASIDRTVRSLG